MSFLRLFVTRLISQVKMTILIDILIAATLSSHTECVCEKKTPRQLLECLRIHPVPKAVKLDYANQL